MAKIIATSEDFCFGSTGMLMSLLSLFKHEHEILFVGTGTALELAKKEGYQDYIDVKTNSSEFRRILEKLSSSHDLLISSMDVHSAVFAVEIGMRVVWLDNIFWYRDNIPSELKSVDYFFCQKGISGDYINKAKEFGIKNFYLTGPLIPQVKTRERKNTLVVSFGGADASNFYKSGKETNYPCIMTDLIIEFVDLSMFEKVVFVSNDLVSLQLSKKIGKSDKYSFTSLNHSEFIELISSCKLLLTSPGQQTMLEAFSSNTPTIMLPASNDTHYHVNSFLRNSVYRPYVLSWDMFFEPQEFLYSTAAQDLDRLWEKIGIFGNSLEMKKNLAQKINLLIKDEGYIKKIAKIQREIKKEIGGDGVKEIFSIIDKFIDEGK